MGYSVSTFNGRNTYINRARKNQEKLIGLKECGIKTVINLMEKEEKNYEGILFEDYIPILKEMGINTYRMPIKDLSIPTFEEMSAIIKLIDESIDKNQPVYVHCWGGIGRTGTVLGCYLLKHQFVNAENVFEYISYLKRTTPIASRVSPETIEQMEFVHAYHRLL